MRRVATISLAVVFWCLGAVLGSPSAVAQGSAPLAPKDRPDPVFNEILLTTDGVTAVDTSGNGWHYNFETSAFERGAPGTAVEPSEKEPQTPEIAGVPVEERCTTERRVKSLERKSVTVGYDEYVDGDIIAWGRVTVKGWVKGNVKSIQKRVLVTETGRVEGDVEAPEIVVKEGGTVVGRLIEGGSNIGIQDITSTFSPGGIIIVLSLSAFLLLSTFLVAALMPRQLNNLHLCFRENKGKAYLLGFLFIFLLPVLCSILVFTIIGIPLVPFVLLAYLFAMILGVISFGDHIGGYIFRKYLGSDRHTSLQSLLGVAMLMSLWLVTAILLGSADSTSQGFGIFFLVLAIMVSTLPVFCGVGTVLLTRFGTRRYLGRAGRPYRGTEAGVPAPAPPPIPMGDGNFTPAPPPYPSGMSRPEPPLPPAAPAAMPPPPPPPPATNDSGIS